MNIPFLNLVLVSDFVLGAWNFPIAILLLALATLGHIVLWIRLFDIIHAVGLSCRVVRPLEKAIVLVCWAIMLVWIVDRLIWKDSLVTPPNAHFATEWVTFAYYYLCVMAGLVTVPLWVSRPWRHRSPGALVEHRTELIDLAKKAESSLTGAKPSRLLMRVPGNQITKLQIEEKVFQLDSLPKELDGWSIAHLSDLHFTGHLTPEFFELIVAEAHRFEADLIALTGDVVDYARYIDWIEPILGKLQSREGGYFVLGNHDVRAYQEDRLRAALAAAGLTDAGPRDNGRWLLHATRGVEILIAGNESPWFPPLPDLSAAPPPRSVGGPFRMLLSHSPDQIHWAKQHEFDFVLAGHTHGGQVRFPWIGPIVAPSKFGVRYSSGEFQEDNTLMQVSRGISGLQPLRINCPPELTKVVLRCRS